MEYDVEIYSKSNCSFCDKAKLLFKTKNIVFKDYNTEEPNILSELLQRNPNARTMPQIFINSEHIGGYQDLVVWFESK